MPNPGPAQLVVFDPIFRGSRLYYSALATRAVAEQADVVIVTRRDAVTDHYHELFDGLPHRLLPVVETVAGFWYGELSPEQVEQGLAAVVAAAAQVATTSALYFPGLNEQMPALVPALRRFGSQLTRTRPVYVEYLPDFLAWPWRRTPPFAGPGGLPWPLRFGRESLGRLRALRRLLRLAPGPYLVLDERLRELPERYYLPPWLARRLDVLSDPAPACELPAPVAAAVDEQPPRPLQLVVFGTQSPRKGLADVVALLESPAFAALDVEIALIGKLTAETEPLRPRLLRQPRLHWTERFVADRELGRLLAACDVALLPYTPAFTASSGSLVRAAQAGLAIVSTEHGLIGHRVQRHGLGATYRAGDLASLLAALRVVGAGTGRLSPALARHQDNARRFAAANSEQAHQATLRRCFGQPDE